MGDTIKLIVTENWQVIPGLVIDNTYSFQNVVNQSMFIREQPSAPAPTDTGKELQLNRSATLVKEISDIWVRMKAGSGVAYFNETPSFTGGGGSGGGVSLHESPVTAIGSVIILSGIDSTKAHCFAGIQFFSDSAGLIPVVPTDGTVTITIETTNTELDEATPAGTIQAITPVTVSWAANTQIVTATPADMAGAAFYKLVVTCNET